jgi:hypothetical protein
MMGCLARRTLLSLLFSASLILLHSIPSPNHGAPAPPRAGRVLPLLSKDSLLGWWRVDWNGMRYLFNFQRGGGYSAKDEFGRWRGSWAIGYAKDGRPLIHIVEGTATEREEDLVTDAPWTIELRTVRECYRGFARRGEVCVEVRFLRP